MLEKEKRILLRERMREREREKRRCWRRWRGPPLQWWTTLTAGEARNLLAGSCAIYSHRVGYRTAFSGRSPVEPCLRECKRARVAGWKRKKSPHSLSLSFSLAYLLYTTPFQNFLSFLLLLLFPSSRSDLLLRHLLLPLEESKNKNTTREKKSPKKEEEEEDGI